MNWYKKIIESKGWSVDKQRRMPEDPQQLYDYYYSDDPPFMKEDFMDYNMKDIDLAKSPDEMSARERLEILSPEPEDRSNIDDRIDRALAFIKSKEGDINMKLVEKYWNKFPNLPEYYIVNYIKKKYELV